ncbi:MAG: amino acid ABC transporter substrate-binding protein [Synechococcaceae cyanobacterium SM2_3_1]|nr:amino acid ABC transporter substrate-binding protein [Synechococcaceae cyanobacterium SM2_3_1]
MRSTLFSSLLGVLCLSSLVSLAAPVAAQGSSKLEEVKSRGTLRCGVNNQLPGFGNLDDAGNYVGFDIDICRALAAAVLGDPQAIEFVSLTAANRQSAIQANEVDFMIRNTTWTLTRDREWGATFGPTAYYDGQGFLVRKELEINELSQLDGASICVISGTTTELNLADVFRARSLAFEPITFENEDTAFTAYEEGRCDAITNDQSSLISRRSTLAAPDDHLILEEIISKEPLGPLVAQGDTQWADIMNWTMFALFYADEKGITSENINTFADSEDPDIQRFLGIDGNLGELLGLEPTWTQTVIESVGNYGEIFDRNLTPLGVQPGLNQPYTEGGIHYAPPFR